MSFCSNRIELTNAMYETTAPQHISDEAHLVLTNRLAEIGCDEGAKNAAHSCYDNSSKSRGANSVATNFVKSPMMIVPIKCSKRDSRNRARAKH
jgi:hypothetical protein